jgi:hypothetical protein
MIKSVGFLLAILLGWVGAYGQEEPVQPPTLGIRFFFHDFQTAWNIRNSSLRQVLRNRQFGRLKDMSPGLAVNYIYGLSKHYDFSASLTGAFLDCMKRDGTNFGSDHLLLEGDVSVRGKMFSNKKWVSPFLQVGTGISKFKSYWGAFIPAGVGVQFNLFQEAYLLINAQYRIAVTETVSNHYFYSLGLAGSIGRRKAANKSVLPL